MGNQLVILNSILDEYFNNGTFKDIDKSFEVFSTEQIFKDYDLGTDEINTGLVGESLDCGIDGFFIFVNGELVNAIDDFELSNKMSLDLNILQYKNKSSIEESVIDKFIVASELIFQLDLELEELLKQFSDTLAEKINLFHEIMKKLASKHPVVSINFFHVSKGDRSNIYGPRFQNTSYQNKISLLEEKVIDKTWRGVKYNYEIVDASYLLEMFRKIPTYSLELKLNENPVAIDYKEGKQRGYIASVNLIDYFKFLCNEDGTLRKYLFESNIRDYQNNTNVNSDIETSITDRKDFDFWWLNNGVTIIAEKGTLVGKTLHLDNIQIVNGLQTSYTIYNAVSASKIETDDRSLLLKIIITDLKESIDMIIKSTNSQNPVPPAFLRATDHVQRQIEEFFLTNGYFYDRRKNYYRNQNKPRKKIVSIMYLSQCLTAILERNPSKARSNPTILTKKEADYKKLFHESRPVQVYLQSIKITRRVEQFLKDTFQPIDSTEISISTYYTFHVARVLTSVILKSPKYNDRDILRIDSDLIDDINIVQSITIVKKILEAFQTEQNQHNQTYISKQIPFSEYITQNLQLYLSQLNESPSDDTETA